MESINLFYSSYFLFFKLGLSKLFSGRVRILLLGQNSISELTVKEGQLSNAFGVNCVPMKPEIKPKPNQNFS